MSIHYSGNLAHDIRAFEADEERAERRRPVCDCCKEPIWEDRVLVLSGRVICDECIPDELDKLKEYTENLMANAG